MAQVSAINQEMAMRNHISISENRNIFIEAGAGAGKSTSLVERTYYSLAEGVETNIIRAEIKNGKSKQDVINELSDFTNCTEKEVAFRKKLISEIDNIIADRNEKITAKDIFAITFTNKATEELRNKIIEKLQDTKGSTQREIDRKRIVLKDIDNIHISTIHKFCEDILKENAIKAGLSPDFVPVIDEEEMDIKNGVIRYFFRRFNNWKDFEKFEVVGLRRSDVKAGIVSVLDSLLCTADRVKYNQVFKCDSFKCDGIQAYYEAVKNLLEEVEDFIGNNPGSKGKLLTTKSIVKKAGFEYGQTKQEREIVIKNLMTCSETEWRNETDGCPIINRPSEDLKQEIIDTFIPLLFKVIQRRNDVYIAIAKQYIVFGYDLYNLYCDNRNHDVETLTSNDLVYRTFVLLSKNQDVLAKTQEKIKKLFIDEYQDTDSLQYQIASLIAGSRSDCLYIVGDPKQSIYRFRGAEPDVFFDTKDQFAKDPNNHAIYTLNINFRSNSKIIEWVNKRYTSIGLIDPSIKYVYSPMVWRPSNEIDPKDYSDPNKLIGFYHYDSIKRDDIKDLILFVKDNYLVREGNTYRKIQFKDIMVLMEGHNMMPGFVETFTKNNIPAKVYGESKFYNTLAIRSFVALFEAILVDMDSSLAQVEAVYYNLTPSIFKDKKSGERKELVKGLLSALRGKTNDMNAYGKAIYLAEHMSLLMKEKHIYQDFEVNFASSKIYQMIETVFSKDFYNGNELIQEFNKFVAKSIERESLIQNDIDAVELINLHKAKGLEAPIVIWVSTKTSDKNADGISDAYKNKVLYPSIITNYVRKSDALMSQVAILKSDEDFEVARKEYVAVTRPGEAYIFADTAENSSMFHGANRNYDLDDEDVREICLPGQEETSEESESKEEEPKAEAEPELVIQVNEDLKEDANKETPVYQGEKEHNPIIGSSSIKSESPSSRESAASPLRNKLREEAGEIVPSNRPKSNDVGTILHRALELLKGLNMSPEEAVNIAMSENMDVVRNQDSEKAFYLACLNTFNVWFSKTFDGDMYELFPEFGFSYYDQESNVISNGSIDLLMKKDDSFIVIDYKSDEAEYIKDDALFEQTLKEKYEPQLNAYEKVVRDLFSVKEIKKQIIYFRRYDSTKQTIDLCCYKLK